MKIKFEKDERTPVRLNRSVENMAKDKHLPRRFEKDTFGVIIWGIENPETYHVQFFEGDEPNMDKYLGFSLVKPGDIEETFSH